MRTNALLLIGLTILLFFTRSIYSFQGPNEMDRDAYAHALYARDIRESGHRIPDRPSDAVTGGIYAYPYLMHWFLSFLPDRWIPSVDRHFSAINDLIFAGLLLSLEPLGILTLSEVILAVGLFIVTPEFMRPDMAHGVGLSGRKPGLIFTVASLLMFIFWLETGAILALGLGVLLGAGVFLISKFSVQAFTFLAVTVAIFVDLSGFVLLGGSLTAAILISKGRYLTILRGHLTHLYDYAVTKQFKISYTRPSLNVLFNLRNAGSIRDILESAYRSSIIRPLVNNPFAVAIVIAFLAFPVSQLSVPVGFDTWIATGLGCFVLISLPYLRFLGEAERYLEYGFFPTVIIFAKGWSNFGPRFDLLVGLVLFAGLITIGTFPWAYQTVFADYEGTDAFDEIIATLRGKDPGTVIVQPVWRARELAWYTDHRVVDSILHGNTTKTSTREFDQLFPEEYGEVTDDITWLADKYQPDWVVFDISDCLNQTKNGLTPPESADPVTKNDRFALYRFEQLQEANHT